MNHEMRQNREEESGSRPRIEPQPTAAPRIRRETEDELSRVHPALARMAREETPPVSADEWRDFAAGLDRRLREVKTAGWASRIAGWRDGLRATDSTALRYGIWVAGAALAVLFAAAAWWIWQALEAPAAPSAGMAHAAGWLVFARARPAGTRPAR